MPIAARLTERENMVLYNLRINGYHYEAMAYEREYIARHRHDADAFYYHATPKVQTRRTSYKGHNFTIKSTFGADELW